MVAALTLAILHLQGLAHPSPARIAGAAALAGTVALEATLAGVDPYLVVATIARESSFRPWKVGAAGEVGLMQVKPGTAAAGWVPRAWLFVPGVNVALGVAHMARVREICGTGDPAAWMSVYNGRRRCRPHSYSLGIVRLAQAERSRHG